MHVCSSFFCANKREMLEHNRPEWKGFELNENKPSLCLVSTRAVLWSECGNGISM